VKENGGEEIGETVLPYDGHRLASELIQSIF
jgi:hypothetical protein